jgi:hypothetical protein
MYQWFSEFSIARYCPVQNKQKHTKISPIVGKLWAVVGIEIAPVKCRGWFKGLYIQIDKFCDILDMPP